MTDKASIQVPFDELKTQRAIILPDRLWEFTKAETGEASYSRAIRLILERLYNEKTRH